MFVFKGISNNQCEFQDTDTGTTYWLHEQPDDGQVQVEGEEATMRVGGRLGVFQIRGGPVRWL